MPRIKAAVGLLAVAVFCIGFNAVRYPIVWEMVAASSGTAASPGDSESASHRASTGESPPVAPVVSIHGTKPADSWYLATEAGPTGRLGPKSADPTNEANVSDAANRQKGSGAANRWSAERAWSDDQGAEAHSVGTAEDGEDAWSKGQYSVSAGTPGNTGNHSSEFNSSEAGRFSPSDSDAGDSRTPGADNSAGYGGPSYSDSGSQYDSSARGGWTSDEKSSSRPGGASGPSGTTKARGSGSRQEQGRSAKNTKTSAQAPKGKGGSSKAAAAGASAAKGREEKTGRKSSAAGQKAQPEAEFFASTPSKSTSTGNTRPQKPSAALAALASGASRYPNDPREKAWSQPAAGHAGHHPSAETPSGYTPADLGDSGNGLSGECDASGKGDTQSPGAFSWANAFGASSNSSQGASGGSGTGNYGSGCTGPTCSIARATRPPDSPGSDFAARNTAERGHGGFGEPSPREGLPPMVPVVATSNAGMDAHFYEPQPAASVARDSWGTSTRESSVDAAAGSSSGSARSTFAGDTAWDRAASPGTSHPAWAGFGSQVRRLPPPDQTAEESTAPTDLGSDGSLPIYPVTHRP